MSQRMRRNGSPTPAGALGGGAVATAGGAGSRLQPMRATVPFQLKQQQQHGSPTRSNGGGGGGNNGGGGGGASGPSGGGGLRTASRSTSPTRGGGSAAARTSPTVATQTGASATSTRGTSPTRGAAPGARGSPPRPPPPPPLLGTVSSPCSSPTHLWTGEVSAAPPPARVRHRRRSPEQSRCSPERRSPSAPVCKAGTCWGPGGAGQGPGRASLPRGDCGAAEGPGKPGAGPEWGGPVCPAAAPPIPRPPPPAGPRPPHSSLASASPRLSAPAAGPPLTCACSDVCGVDGKPGPLAASCGPAHPPLAVGRGAGCPLDRVTWFM